MKNTMVVFLAVLFCSFASRAVADGKPGKERPIHQRGWIGGEYKLARAHAFPQVLFPSQAVFYYDKFPASVSQTQRAGIFIRKLGTNTPASLGGLQQGDLIVSVEGHPVTSLRGFRRIVDSSEPGTLLNIVAYRADGMVDCKVAVGRERFRYQGVFAMTLPTVVHSWDLWPNPDFSFVVVGWDLNRGVRRELGTRKEVVDDDWSAWLGIFEVRSSKCVLSQEHVAAVMPR